MRHKLYAALAGIQNSDTPSPEATGMSRGLAVAAVLGVLNAVLLFIRIPDAQKAALITALNPLCTMLGFLLFAKWDRWLKDNGRKE